jgi:hypothetical protein
VNGHKLQSTGKSIAFSNYVLAEIDQLFEFLCVEEVQGILATDQNPLFYSILRPPVFVKKLEFMFSAPDCGPLGGM